MNADPQGSTSNSSLQRGKACLSCRRRKMRCDGLRPICTPCLRGERAEDCEYTDGHRRARTLVLEEDVARLRARVQELENPEATMPAVELHVPYASAAAGPSTSPTGSEPYHHGSLVPSRTSPAADPLRLDPEVGAHVSHALSVVAPYATELGFFLDVDRLRAQGTYILPALQSALTLWSIHITSVTNQDRGQAFERNRALAARVLLQVQTQFASALSVVNADPDPAILLHVIQTSVLLAYYMQRIGQSLGARYYASGAWGLAMMLKLHDHPPLAVDVGEDDLSTLRAAGASMRGNTIPCPFAFAGCSRLAPALDEIEAQERIQAFWVVYALDQYFNAVGQGVSQPLGTSGYTITVPWPEDEQMGQANNVIQNLLDDPDHDFTRDGASTIHAKAAVLLGEARVLASSYAADNAIGTSAAFQARFGMLDTLLERCLDAAVRLATECPPHSPAQRHALVTLHLIALAHVIHHRPFLPTHSPSARRCEAATFAVVRTLDHIHDLGVKAGCVSPLYVIVWTALCLAMHDEVLHLRAQPNVDPSNRRELESVGAIQKLVNKLSAMSQRCPNEFFAGKIEALLPVLESIAI